MCNVVTSETQTVVIKCIPLNSVSHVYHVINSIFITIIKFFNLTIFLSYAFSC